jgi:hypothetical protein
MRLFHAHEAVHAGPGPPCGCVHRGPVRRRWAKPGSFRVARTIASRGKSADDGEWYNPTLSCANRDFMLFRMNRDRIRFCPKQGGGNREGKNFFIWIRCNPLKSPDSTKEIQGNASLFPGFIWICLDLFGRHAELASARFKPWRPRRRRRQSHRASPQAGRTAARGGRLRE